MKILLVQCPVYDAEMPPLGIACLSAVLKSRGFLVEVLDINVDFFHSYPKYKIFWNPANYRYCLPSNFFIQIDELDKIVDIYADKVLKTRADIIGFSIQTTSSAFSTHLSSKIKEKDPSKKIIFGGPECSRENDPGYFFKKPGKVDYVVLREGEVTLPEMIDRIINHRPLTDCRGLLICDGKDIINTGPRDLISDLDSLPIPDFSLFPLDKYLHKDALPVLMSRGCIRGCSFCIDRWHQGRYRNKSCGRLVDEIVKTYAIYSMRRMRFNDLLINGDLRLLEDLCDALIKTGINDLFWSGNMIVRKDIPRYLFRKMYKAGCRTVTFGVESASNNVLRLMNKDCSVEEIENNLKDIKRAGIDAATNWIVGFPGENRDDLFDTMKFIARNKRYIHQASMANCLEIIKGSILHQNANRLNIKLSQKEGWTMDGNTPNERIYRQNILNEFLQRIGMLNATQNTANIYRKGRVGHFRIRSILRGFKKRLSVS